PGPVVQGQVSHAPSKPAMIPMIAVGDTLATAELAFEESYAGTRITMHCAYPMTSEVHWAYTFRLFAIGADGQTEQVNSWKAAPGEEVTMTGMVRLGMEELTRIELRNRENSVLLVYTIS